MIIKSLFKPLWWLKNPHGQTIYSSIRRHLKLPQYRPERFELPDGDFVDLAWVDSDLPKDPPLVDI
jgi:predicted alpha/beta-fold hydrolase